MLQRLHGVWAGLAALRCPPSCSRPRCCMLEAKHQQRPRPAPAEPRHPSPPNRPPIDCHAVAAQCALEAVKLVTLCSTGLNNYMMCAPRARLAGWLGAGRE